MWKLAGTRRVLILHRDMFLAVVKEARSEVTKAWSCLDYDEKDEDVELKKARWESSGDDESEASPIIRDRLRSSINKTHFVKMQTFPCLAIKIYRCHAIFRASLHTSNTSPLPLRSTTVFSHNPFNKKSPAFPSIPAHKPLSLLTYIESRIARSPAFGVCVQQLRRPISLL